MLVCLRPRLLLSFRRGLQSKPVSRRCGTAAGSMPSQHQHSFKVSSTGLLVLSQGDITRFEGDAIVNAANERMLGGGGVDGAIHRAAGDELYEECKTVPEVTPRVRCPTGEARITKGYQLPAKHVIHTVGPVYFSPEESEPLLANAYRNSLRLANEHGLKKIAFPAISTGVFGYPKRDAAEVSLRVVKEAIDKVEEVHFVLFGQETMDAWLEAARKLLPTAGHAEDKAADAKPAEAGAAEVLSAEAKASEAEHREL